MMIFKREMRVLHKKNKLALAVLLSISFLLTGCSFLPVEEEAHSYVVAKTLTDPIYEYAQVTRGDVLLTKKIFCTYSQMEEENLRFETQGRPVDMIYVHKGDTVKKGDLLLELEDAALREQMEDIEYSIRKYELQKKHLAQTYEFDKKELQGKKQSMAAEDYDYYVRKLDRSYEENLSKLEDELFILRMHEEAVGEELDGCRIYAGLDGIVSYYNAKLYNRSLKAGEVAFTIIDTSYCTFSMGEMDYAEYFPVGGEIELTDNTGTVYETRVLPYDEEAQEVRLELQNIDVAPEVGGRATINLVLQEKRDTLKVANTAIHMVNDQYYVYRGDDAGLKEMQYVTLGLVGDSETEILSGLAEGDIVIKK